MDNKEFWKMLKESANANMPQGMEFWDENVGTDEYCEKHLYEIRIGKGLACSPLMMNGEMADHSARILGKKLADSIKQYICEMAEKIKCLE